MDAWSGFLQTSDRLIPHDIAGGLLVAGLSLAALAYVGISSLAWLLILIALIGIAVAVDLSVWGFKH